MLQKMMKTYLKYSLYAPPFGGWAPDPFASSVMPPWLKPCFMLVCIRWAGQLALCRPWHWLALPMCKLITEQCTVTVQWSCCVVCGSDALFCRRTVLWSQKDFLPTHCPCFAMAPVHAIHNMLWAELNVQCIYFHVFIILAMNYSLTFALQHCHLKTMKFVSVFLHHIQYYNIPCSYSYLYLTKFLLFLKSVLYLKYFSVWICTYVPSGSLS